MLWDFFYAWKYNLFSLRDNFKEPLQFTTRQQQLFLIVFTDSVLFKNVSCRSELQIFNTFFFQIKDIIIILKSIVIITRVFIILHTIYTWNIFNCSQLGTSHILLDLHYIKDTVKIAIFVHNIMIFNCFYVFLCIFTDFLY